MQYKVCKKLTKKLVEKYRSKLFLHRYHIHINYSKSSKKEGNEKILGEATINSKYLRASIDIYPDNIASIAELEKTVRHELLHILHGEYDDHLKECLDVFVENNMVNESDLMWNFSRPIVERLVTQIELILDNNK